MDRSLLSRATDSSDAPTPGYMYVDLAQQAASNPQVCNDMAMWLIQRLQNKQAANIKFKACKVIAKLCENVPRNAFRKCLTQNPGCTQALHDASNFRGPIDPVNGDTKNERVRSAAKEALKAVYATDTSQATSPHAQGQQQMSGYYGGSGGGGGGMGGSRMEGFGSQNSSYNPHASQQLHNPYGSDPNANLKAAVREAGSVIAGMIKDPLARNVAHDPAVPAQGHAELPGYGSRRAGRPPPGSSELSRQTGGQWTMASNRGPGAIQHMPPAAAPPSHGGHATHASSGTVGGSWGSAAAAPPVSTPSISVNQQYVPSNSAPVAPAVQDGSYEKNLVLELCPPGGLKAVPPPDKLAAFTKAVPSLNADLVCPVLLDCLEDGQPWVIRAKALCVMESCIQAGGIGRPDGTNPYRNFFFACQEEIVPLANHSRAAIKDPARRVLTALGVDSASVAAAPSPTAAVEPPNLLDFDSAPAAPQQAPPPPPTEAPPPPPAAQPTAATTPGGSSMFGGMQVKTATPNGGPPAAPAPPVPAAPTSGNLLDFMGSNDAAPVASNPAPPVDAAGASSMFAQMSVKDEKKDTTPQAAEQENGLDSLTAPAAGGGSAFGFINNNASAAAPASQAPAATSTSAAVPPPPPAGDSKSFDPLMNLTPTTAAKKAMTLSPEQMQAMAYQQMMMQQQQLQMQMAMMAQQQQQQRGSFTGGQPGMMAPPMYPPLSTPVPVAQQQRIPSGSGHSTGASAARPAQREDHKFDFVKDAMSSAK